MGKYCDMHHLNEIQVRVHIVARELAKRYLDCRLENQMHLPRLPQGLFIRLRWIFKFQTLLLSRIKSPCKITSKLPSQQRPKPSARGNKIPDATKEVMMQERATGCGVS
jgi:hypothetical protein